MLISEFAREAGLTPDTVRFYIRRGLLDPARGEKGGSARYQIFQAAHIERARLIRLAQALGFTLREIAALDAEFQKDAVSDERLVAILRGRLRDLDEKAAQIGAMAGYLERKLRWIEDGRVGPEPALDAHGAQADAISACAADRSRQVPAVVAAEKLRPRS